MTRRCVRVFVLALVTTLGVVARPASAEDTPVVFVHGIFSSGDAWRQTAARLASTLRIEPHVVDLNSRDLLENQAAQLHALKGGLPSHTIAVAHSQGGLISRQWSRSKTLGGLLTLGTPHFGAPLSRNALDVIHFNHVLYNLFGLVSTWGYDTEVGWVVAALSHYVANGLQLSSGVAARLLSTVAVSGYVPVAPQLAPGSNLLVTLNDDGNLLRESYGIGRRVGLNFIAHDYWRAGVGVGLAPDYREWIWGVQLALPPVLDYAAAFVETHYPSKFGLAAQLRNASGFVRELDPMWCWAVTNDRTCRTPHDGIVPTSHQVYPNATNYVVGGPAHTQETDRSEPEIRSVLVTAMGVAYRGSGGETAGGTTVTGGTRLYVDQELRSPNGTTLRYQHDGNLVLYAPGGRAIWSSSTAGLSAGYVEMQGDGNLVVYDHGGTPRWASDTYAPGAALVIHDQGYAAIVDPSGNTVWWTN